jgi:hypothetical protein
MVKATPAIAQAWARDKTGNSQKWIGAWCHVLKPTAPLEIRMMAADLHNKRTHNTRTSTLVDLVRSLQTMALANYDRCKAKFVADGFTYRIPPPSTYFLTPDQVFQAYSQSGYDPGDRLKKASSLEKADIEVYGLGGWAVCGINAWRARHGPPILWSKTPHIYIIHR